MGKKKEIKKLKRQVKELQKELASCMFRNEDALMKAVWVEKKLDMFFEQKKFKNCQTPNDLAAENNKVKLS